MPIIKWEKHVINCTKEEHEAVVAALAASMQRARAARNAEARRRESPKIIKVIGNILRRVFQAKPTEIEKTDTEIKYRGNIIVK